MTILDTLRSRITPIDEKVAAEARRLLDAKTKPRGSLGRLEDLACRVAAIRGSPALPLPKKAIVVMAADHGVADEGVSAYPSEVTAQMLLNFARGGAAINVLARHVGADVVVADLGVREPPASAPEIRSLRVAPGTQSFARGPAMTRERAIAAAESGIQLAQELIDEGYGLLGLGDMGIGNTTCASAIASVLTGTPPEEVAGRGTGIDDTCLRRKIEVIRRGLAVNRPDPGDAIDVISKVGGFEIAGLVGVVLGATQQRVPVVVDGFPTSVAALAATRIAPAARDSLIASHRSVEPGHGVVLQALGIEPLLDLQLRLGEGTGAALAMGLVDAALRVLLEMATFESAGVADSGA